MHTSSLSFGDAGSNENYRIRRFKPGWKTTDLKPRVCRSIKKIYLDCGFAIDNMIER